MEKKKVHVEVTQAILDQNYDYLDGTNCSVFHGLEEAGLPVSWVEPECWIDANNKRHPLPACCRISGNPNGDYKLAGDRGFIAPFAFDVDPDEVWKE